VRNLLNAYSDASDGDAAAYEIAASQNWYYADDCAPVFEMLSERIAWTLSFRRFVDRI